jgi:hypothetical protein
MAVQVQPITVDEIRRHAQGDRLFAVVDVVDDVTLSEYLDALPGARAVSLFDGTEHEPYTAVAPRLIHLDARSVETLLFWSVPYWGVMLVAEGGLEQVRLHLREILFAILPDTRRYLFRFYDPRVLAAFLPICSRDDALEFFGDVTTFILPDTHGVPAVRQAFLRPASRLT